MCKLKKEKIELSYFFCVTFEIQCRKKLYDQTLKLIALRPNVIFTLRDVSVKKGTGVGGVKLLR